MGHICLMPTPACRGGVKKLHGKYQQQDSWILARSALEPVGHPSGLPAVHSRASGSAGSTPDIETTLSTASTAIERSKAPSWRQIRKQQQAIMGMRLSAYLVHDA